MNDNKHLGLTILSLFSVVLKILSFFFKFKYKKKKLYPNFQLYDWKKKKIHYCIQLENNQANENVFFGFIIESFNAFS